MIRRLHPRLLDRGDCRVRTCAQRGIDGQRRFLVLTRAPVRSGKRGPQFGLRGGLGERLGAAGLDHLPRLADHRHRLGQRGLDLRFRHPCRKRALELHLGPGAILALEQALELELGLGRVAFGLEAAGRSQDLLGGFAAAAGKQAAGEDECQQAGRGQWATHHGPTEKGGTWHHGLPHSLVPPSECGRTAGGAASRPFCRAFSRRARADLAAGADLRPSRRVSDFFTVFTSVAERPSLSR